MTRAQIANERKKYRSLRRSMWTSLLSHLASEREGGKGINVGGNQTQNKGVSNSNSKSRPIFFYFFFLLLSWLDLIRLGTPRYLELFSFSFLMFVLVPNFFKKTQRVRVDERANVRISASVFCLGMYVCMWVCVAAYFAALSISDSEASLS